MNINDKIIKKVAQIETAHGVRPGCIHLTMNTAKKIVKLPPAFWIELPDSTEWHFYGMKIVLSSAMPDDVLIFTRSKEDTEILGSLDALDLFDAETVAEAYERKKAK